MGTFNACGQNEAKLLSKLRRLYPTWHWKFNEYGDDRFSYMENTFVRASLTYEQAESFVYHAVKNAKLELERVQRIARE